MADVIRQSKALKVVLDHHVSSDDLGAEFFKNVEAEASGRLVVDAADQLGVQLSPAIAQPAMVALATDTGWFRFASTTADTFRLAARLVDAGAKPDRLYKELYETDSHGRLQLIGRTLARSETELGGRLIYSWITNEDFSAVGAVPSDSEDIINMMLAVGGTEAAAILVEQHKGGFKVSFRSRCHMDCSAVSPAIWRRWPQEGPLAHSSTNRWNRRGKKVLDAVRAAMQSPPTDAAKECHNAARA